MGKYQYILAILSDKDVLIEVYYTIFLMFFYSESVW